MGPVPARAFASQTLFEACLKREAQLTHLLGKFLRKPGGDQRVDGEIILQRGGMEAGDVPSKGTGEVQRRLKPALKTLIIINMEQDRLHGTCPFVALRCRSTMPRGWETKKIGRAHV